MLYFHIYLSWFNLANTRLLPISSINYEQLFCTKVVYASLLYLKYRFVLFWWKKIVEKLLLKCWWNWELVFKRTFTKNVWNKFTCGQILIDRQRESSSSSSSEDEYSRYLEFKVIHYSLLMFSPPRVSFSVWEII